MTKALLKSHNSEMLNAIQERTRCNGLVIIPWLNTIPFQELIGDHFGVDVKRDGDHFGIGVISRLNWGSFKGWGAIRGRDHFRGGCTSLKKVPLSGKASPTRIAHYRECPREKIIRFSK